MERFVYSGTPKKISKILSEKFPYYSYSYIQKVLRKGDVKVDGVRIKSDVTVSQGADVAAYLLTPELTLVFENDIIAVFNKFSGISSENYAALVAEKYPSFLLAHRLDTNTTGLLLFAKSSDVFESLKEAFKAHLIEKHYYCEVFGSFPENVFFKDYLTKDAIKGTVKLYSTPAPGRMSVETECVLMSRKGDVSVLDVSPLTGRTHQIRAHLAYRGYPVVGDEKYGDVAKNKAYKSHRQHLCSTKLVFHCKGVDQLDALDGLTVEIPAPKYD